MEVKSKVSMLESIDLNKKGAYFMKFLWNNSGRERFSQ